MVSHRDLALLTARSQPFSDPGWLFELKLDGYRLLAVRDDAVRLITRQGSDLTLAFPEVAEAVGTLPAGTAIDGELVILDQHGRPQFNYLARAWSARPSAIKNGWQTRPDTLMAFDILMDAGVDVRLEPIEKRKARLANVPLTNHLRPLLPIEGKGEWLYRQAEILELEGIVAKRNGSIFAQGVRPTG